MPFKYIVAVSTGQAIAGVMLNVIEYILLGFLGDGNLAGSVHITRAFIFFFFSALVAILNIVFIYVNNI
jgi:hypothetical protein